MQTIYAGGAKKLVITTKARLSRSKQKVGAYASPPSSIGLSTEAGYIEQNSIMIVSRLHKPGILLLWLSVTALNSLPSKLVFISSDNILAPFGCLLFPDSVHVFALVYYYSVRSVVFVLCVIDSVYVLSFCMIKL